MNSHSAIEFRGDSRVHIALTVADLQESRAFYEVLLGVAPTKERPGYVKFEPDEPSVNLTLNQVEVSGEGGKTATHYGIQVKSTSAVQDAVARLTKAGLATSVEENTTCCYAVQHKVWVVDPDGNPWEVFVVTQADAERRKDDASECCATESSQPEAGACC